MKAGRRNLITDVAGLRVGNASDEGLKSGVSVLVGDAPVACAVDVMGGAPGTRETDLLAPDKLVPAVDALVLSGGSAFGLAAADGVVDGLRAQGRGFAVGPALVPIVPAAILFDLLNGGDKDWTANPYPALGRAALAAADEAFSLGSVGAGCGASTATLKGGLGSASVVLENGATVGALVAVNALGGATPSGQPEFWAAPFEVGAEFGARGVVKGGAPFANAAVDKLAAMAGANTTIAIVATDVALDKAGLKRLAVAAQDGLARALVPAHTPYDGDLVFAVSTGARELGDRALDLLTLGHGAACCLSRAVARGVYEARAMPGDTLPSWQSLWGAPG